MTIDHYSFKNLKLLCIYDEEEVDNLLKYRQEKKV